MSSADASQKIIVLKSSDGETFEVEELVALESQTIKYMIEDNCADTTIPLPNVTSRILAKVIEYCKKHVEAASKATADGGMCSSYKVVDDELKAFDTEFVKVDQGTLFDLILAANYLNIKSLLGLTCKTVADMIKGKTTEEIRKTFNIKNDFTPEEERRFEGRMHGHSNPCRRFEGRMHGHSNPCIRMMSIFIYKLVGLWCLGR